MRAPRPGNRLRGRMRFRTRRAFPRRWCSAGIRRSPDQATTSRPVLEALYAGGELVGLVEAAFEGVEAAGPEMAVGREPGVDLREWLGPELVAPALGGDPDVHQASLSQHPEVFRDRGLAESHRVDELADGPLALPQQVEDGAAPGFGQHVEGLHHP